MEHRQPRHMDFDEARIVKTAPVLCPRCHAPTDALKSYSVHILVFSPWIIWNCEQVIACPRCMRRALVRKMLLAVPLSNLLFPVMWVFYIVQWVSAGNPGHTDPVLAEKYRVTSDEMLANLPQAINLGKPHRREWLVVAGIILVIAAIWFSAYLSGPRNEVGGRPDAVRR